MAVTIRSRLERCATRRVSLAAFAGIVACVAGLAWRADRLDGLPLLDSRIWYTPDEAAALFDALDRLDASARHVYAATGLTVDMAFPAAYGLFFAILLFHLFRQPFYLLPLALAAADALENVAIAALALAHTGSPSPLALPAAVFTLVKWLLCAATLAATAAGALRRLGGRIRR